MRVRCQLQGRTALFAVVFAVSVACFSGCGSSADDDNNPASNNSGTNGNGVKNVVKDDGGGLNTGSNPATFKTTTINGVTWMAENLNIKTGNSSCYDNNSSNCAKYGRLYDWETAQTACPSGWRLPTKKEWDDLISYVGGSSAANSKLKATSGWNEGSNNGTDEFRFSALPGGYRIYGYENESNNYNSSTGAGSKAHWWYTGDLSVYAYKIMSNCNTGPCVTAGGSDLVITAGFANSIRCVKN